MTAEPALEQHTYPPVPAEDVAALLGLLNAHRAEIPGELRRIIEQVAEAMKAGQAVTIVSQSLLTTQQTADLLGVSRPTVVRLIEAGELPAETPGKRRRMVRLDDVLALADRRDRQRRALAEIAFGYDDLDEDPDVVARRLRRIRAELAAERRAAEGA